MDKFRFLGSVINPNTHQAEPWFRPDKTDGERLELVEKASPGNFILKCSRFHAYFEVLVAKANQWHPEEKGSACSRSVRCHFLNKFQCNIVNPVH